MIVLLIRHLFYNIRLISYDFSDRFLSVSGLDTAVLFLSGQHERIRISTFF